RASTSSTGTRVPAVPSSAPPSVSKKPHEPPRSSFPRPAAPFAARADAPLAALGTGGTADGAAVRSAFPAGRGAPADLTCGPLHTSGAPLAAPEVRRTHRPAGHGGVGRARLPASRARSELVPRGGAPSPYRRPLGSPRRAD